MERVKKSKNLNTSHDGKDLSLSFVFIALRAGYRMKRLDREASPLLDGKTGAAHWFEIVVL